MTEVFEIAPLDATTLEQVRLLHLAVFPIRYTEKFFSRLLESKRVWTLVGRIDGRVVGCIAADVSPEAPDRLYIFTIGVLAPFRGTGFGTLLLRRLLSEAAADSSLSCVYLHVHTANERAVAFYRTHHFVLRETLPTYYKRIDPPSAHVLEYSLTEARQKQSHHGTSEAEAQQQ